MKNAFNWPKCYFGCYLVLFGLCNENYKYGNIWLLDMKCYVIKKIITCKELQMSEASNNNTNYPYLLKLPYRGNRPMGLRLIGTADFDEKQEQEMYYMSIIINITRQWQ